MVGPLEAVGIGLIKAVSTQAGGAVLKKLKRLVRGVPQYGAVAPKPLVTRATKSLLEWKRGEQVSDEDFLVGAETAQEILERAALPTAADLSDHAGPEALVARWMHDLEGRTLTDTAIGVCRRVLDEVLALALLDPEYRERLTLDVVLQLSKLTLPTADPIALSLASKSVALKRTEDDIRSVESRRKLDPDGDRWPSFEQVLRYDWVEEVARWTDVLVRSAPGHDLRMRLRQYVPGPRERFTGIRRRLISNDFWHAVEDLLDQLRHVGQPTQADTDALRDAARAARMLRDASASPNYRVVLPVVGSWGSGKTDLIASISRELLPYGVPTLRIRAGATSFTAAILDAARTMFRRDFDSVDEFAETMQKNFDLVLLAIDDLDRWAATDPLIESQFRVLVEDLTSSRVFRWVLTAEPTGLRQLYAASDEDFWVTYGYQHEGRPIGRRERLISSGWLDLDDLVHAEGIGLRLLSLSLPSDLLQDLEQIDVAEDQFRVAAHTLARPRSATLLALAFQQRIDADEATSATDLFALLTDEFFVSEYWRQSLNSLARDAGERERLARLRGELAEFFAAGEGESVDEGELRGLVFGQSPDTREVGIALRLIDGLVASNLVTRDDAGLAPSTGILWGRLVADALGPDLWLSPDLVAEQLSSWHGKTDPRDYELARYVIRAKIDSISGRPEYAWLIPIAWERLLRADTDNSALWFAALAVQRPWQDKLAVAALTWAKENVGSGDTFAVLYWCRHAPDGVWSMLATLEMLALKFAGVRSLGLASFLLGATDRALSAGDLASGAALDATLRKMRTADESGVGDRLAMLIVERFATAMDASTLLSGILEHFRRDETAPQRLESREIRGFDVELLESGVNAALAKNFRVTSRFLLHGPWTQSRNEELNSVLRRASRTFIGNWYRRDRTRVIELVVDLLDSGTDDLQAAFFIVRHTATTSGAPEVQIDTQLGFAIEAFRERLLDFPRTMRRKWVEPLIRANLGHL